MNSYRTILAVYSAAAIFHYPITLDVSKQNRIRKFTKSETIRNCSLDIRTARNRINDALIRVVPL